MDYVVVFKGLHKSFTCVGDSERLLDQVRVVRIGWLRISERIWFDD
jgi:hypothetical protein